MTRYEVKLVTAAADLARVRAELQLLPVALRPLHPSRVVQSIYLDTHDGLALQDNLAGIARRQKLRLRWYGDDVGAVHGQLEWKCRDNNLGDKEVLPLPVPITVTGATRRGFCRALHEAVTPRWQQRLRGREPAQWIRYHRDYLASADGSLRLTLDRDIAAFDLRFDFVLSDRRRTPLPRLLVIEIKAAAADREAIEAWLQHVGLPPGKCSKFVLASLPGEARIVSRL